MMETGEEQATLCGGCGHPGLRAHTCTPAHGARWWTTLVDNSGGQLWWTTLVDNSDGHFWWTTLPGGIYCKSQVLMLTPWLCNDISVPKFQVIPELLFWVLTNI